MAKIKVIPYDSEWKGAWDKIVSTSRNGTFLHYRNYMEYHAGRFEDCSVLVMDGESPFAVFPANRDGNKLVSHGGLTFGGLLFGSDRKANEILEALGAVLRYYRSTEARTLTYKSVPYIFHSYPSDDDLYALFRYNARLIRRDLSCAIEMAHRIKYSNQRKRGISKARKSGIEVRTGSFYSDFHSLLADVLVRHDAEPVHSAAEIEMLTAKFPDHISLHGAFYDGDMVAGIWVFRLGRSLHAQYLASSEIGRTVGALDLLIDNLIETASPEIKYISFGASTENGGLTLNKGLMRQKEGFGARSIALDHYEIDLWGDVRD